MHENRRIHQVCSAGAPPPEQSTPETQKNTQSQTGGTPHNSCEVACHASLSAQSSESPNQSFAFSVLEFATVRHLCLAAVDEDPHSSCDTAQLSSWNANRHSHARTRHDGAPDADRERATSALEHPTLLLRALQNPCVTPLSSVHKCDEGSGGTTRQKGVPTTDRKSSSIAPCEMKSNAPMYQLTEKWHGRPNRSKSGTLGAEELWRGQLLGDRANNQLTNDVTKKNSSHAPRDDTKVIFSRTGSGLLRVVPLRKDFWTSSRVLSLPRACASSACASRSRALLSCASCSLCTSGPGGISSVLLSLRLSMLLS